MTMTARERRDNLQRPFRTDHVTSQEQLMERRGNMPKDLPGLLRWFEDELRYEMPADLHTDQVWRDHVTAKEREAGLQPVGASDTGALAYDSRFRKLIEFTTARSSFGPTLVDHSDPENARSGMAYLENPVEAALGRIARAGNPLMARHLQLLAWAGFDWRKRADLIGWALEEYEVYIREALIRLWREHREWVRAN